MKLPVSISVKYIGNSDLPIMSVDSLHVITNNNDIGILADYVSMFSSSEFTADDIKHCIEICQKEHVFNIKNDIEWLGFSVS